MITIYDIAKRCGVTASTVSKVINNYKTIPESTRQRVLKAMQDMNYIPNQNATTLSSGHSKNVGVLAYLDMNISTFKHSLFANILDSFQEEMNDQSYDLLFVSRNVRNGQESFYKNCIARHVDGVLLFGDMYCEEINEIIESDIPAVGFEYIGNKITGIYSDNYDLMYNLTKHLIDLGHERIAFVYGDENAITTRRIEGYKNAIADNNITLNSEYLCKSIYLDIAQIENIARKLLTSPTPPTAIMCPDDLSAIKVISVAKSLGFSCPEDISITGFDGLDVSQLVTPKLTTARQDTKKIGSLLADKLLTLMNNKNVATELVRVPGQILIGDSTGAPRK